MKRFLVALFMSFALVVPTVSIVNTPMASATSPNRCAADPWLGALWCFQIVGPRGTNIVDVFQGTIENIKTSRLAVVVQIFGPSYQWDGRAGSFVGSVYEIIGSKSMVHYFIPEFKRMRNGKYCARLWTLIHDSYPICNWLYVY